MKRLLAVSYGVGVRKALLGVLVVVVPTMGIAYAQERVINKISKPAVIVVLSDGGFGLAFFQLLNVDFPPGTTTLPKKLLGIEWTTTYYPDAIGESIELCYFRPYNRVRENCREISKNSSGVMFDFNDLPFGNGAQVVIRHDIKGAGVRIANAAGNDSVTYRYSY